MRLPVSLRATTIFQVFPNELPLGKIVEPFIFFPPFSVLIVGSPYFIFFFFTSTYCYPAENRSWILGEWICAWDSIFRSHAIQPSLNNRCCTRKNPTRIYTMAFFVLVRSVKGSVPRFFWIFNAKGFILVVRDTKNDKLKFLISEFL